MTNTNDFRRYSYQYDTSYMVQGFNVSRSSAAPKRTPKTEKEPNKKLKLHENITVKSAQQIYKEERLCTKQTVLLSIVALLVVALFAFTLHSFALKNELTREVSAVETQISLQQSEYISLKSRLDSMVSISMIDEYAVNELHMSKAKLNQIQYINVDEYKQKRMAEIQKSSPAVMAKQLGNK